MNLHVVLLQAAALASLMVPAPGAAEQARPCQSFSFEGELNEGKAFRRDIGNGLVFHADPTEGGWHFEIGRASPAGADDTLVYDVTIPLHGRHATDLDTSYGTPAQDAVGDDPVTFWFVANPQDAEKSGQGQELVHWPKTDADEKRGWDLLGSLPKGRGELQMLKWKLTSGTAEADSGDPDASHYGAIHWLSFRLELTVPAAFTPPADLKATPSECPRELKYWPFEGPGFSVP